MVNQACLTEFSRLFLQHYSSILGTALGVTDDQGLANRAAGHRGLRLPQG